MDSQSAEAPGHSTAVFADELTSLRQSDCVNSLYSSNGSTIIFGDFNLPTIDCDQLSYKIPTLCLSCTHSILTATWLISFITPVFKKGNPAEASYYRPIN